MNDINKKNVILGIICVILFVVVGYLFIFDNSEKEEVIEKKESSYVLLKDYSRFFTVNSCIYKYINYLSSKNYDNLFKVLDKDYVTNNSITETNIYNYLPELDGDYSYVSKKMYYKKLNDNIYSYYVYGYLYKDLIDSRGEKVYYSYQVNIDQKNGVFSILPYNGNLFKGVSNE